MEVRGLHAYLDVWTPAVGAVLLLQREAENTNAVAVVKANGTVVGHIPWNLLIGEATHATPASYQ